MKLIDTNKLNRFWRNGVRPIAEEAAKKLNSSNVVNNLLTTKAGFVLDARQGKVLQDQVDEINGNTSPCKYVFTPLDNPYTSNPELTLKKSAGLIVGRVSFVLKDVIPSWEDVTIGNISNWSGESVYGICCSVQGGGAVYSQGVMIRIKPSGEVFLDVHGTITDKNSWFYGVLMG